MRPVPLLQENDELVRPAKRGLHLADDVYFLRNGRIVWHRGAADMRGPAAGEEAIESYLGGRSQAPAMASA